MHQARNIKYPQQRYGSKSSMLMPSRSWLRPQEPRNAALSSVQETSQYSRRNSAWVQNRHEKDEAAADGKAKG